jgi:hypothetical protein
MIRRQQIGKRRVHLDLDGKISEAQGRGYDNGQDDRAFFNNDERKPSHGAG